MKKKLLWLLLVCIILSGCHDDVTETTQTTQTLPMTRTESVTQEIPTTSDEPSTKTFLTEQGVALEEGGNVCYIPNAAIESMTIPQIFRMGEGLLFGECGESEFLLKHISLEDGTLIREGSVPASFGAKLYLGAEEIGLCDRDAGRISILNTELQLKRTYDVTQEGENWYLNSALDTLYVFCADRGILARNLETGAESWILDDGVMVSVLREENGAVLFQYTDRRDQKTYTKQLNLSASVVEEEPKWDTVFTLDETDLTVRSLSAQHLLGTDPSGRNFSLYETDGTFQSQCVLPQNSNAMVGADFVWCEELGGYFFIDFIDFTYRLMFWDVAGVSEGENLPIRTAEQMPPRLISDEQLYERAAALSQRFGVDIRIGEQCEMEFINYESYPLTDPMFIREGLDMLENCLSKYPEGFFEQLHYDKIRSIRFELVGGLMAEEEQNILGSMSAVAFAQNNEDYYLIALSGFELSDGTVYHEISHIIDKRLKWDSQIREDALYSEDAWLALQPEGFRFAYSYSDVPEELRQFMETRYFVSEYAMTYPTEDRAVIMESAMMQHNWIFEEGSGKQEKLKFYAACIRDCFDTDGWPETTSWELVLKAE